MPILAATRVRDVLRIVADHLEQAGIEEPRREARLLVAAALGTGLAGVIAGENLPVGAEATRVVDMMTRRAAREPLSRILGRREFHGLDFALNAATLDPRPDSETLVDVVLAILGAENRAGDAVRILDLGTGTGAILLALLHRLPAALGLGIDIAGEAVLAARANGMALGLAGRANFQEGDLFARMIERFEVIVSNPPYIPTDEIAALDPEVRLHDPLLALDGGPDGLAFYRRIAEGAPAHLVPGGLLALEVGQGQAEPVRDLVAAAGFGEVRWFVDLGGTARVIVARMRLS